MANKIKVFARLNMYVAADIMYSGYVIRFNQIEPQDANVFVF